MERIRFKWCPLFLLGLIAACEQSPVARFEIATPDPVEHIEQLVWIDLDSVTALPENELVLIQYRENQQVSIPFQIEEGVRRKLYWNVVASESETNQYELIKATPREPFELVGIKNDDGVVTISSGNTKFLQYHSETVYPPDGVDSVFKRSAFIHPLWTPKGQVLTRIQPPDHYHHYGIWNPWTHVLFEGDTIDFWNLYKKQGTVRFTELTKQQNGPLFAEFSIRHEHVVFKKDSAERIALQELQTIRVSVPPDKDYFFVDFTSEMKCGTESPFRILEYRYGGFGWRAIAEWNPENSEVLTSDGKTRKDADGSTARWTIVQGALGNDYGGMVIFSHPENYNHPEPLRIWPEDSNGGEMFVNVAPTKTADWLLEPGNTYTLRYRLLVFNGHFTKEWAEQGWQQFVHIPEIKIER